MKMTRLSIRGGVHPDGNKSATADCAIEQLPLPQRLLLPLRQHAGDSAEPVVRVGDSVGKGQLLAIGAGRVSASLHAPTSGTIAAIGEIVAPHPSRLTAPAITLITDGEDRWCERQVVEDPFALSPESISERVDQAGIVGLGGATFPAAIKLRQGSRQQVDTLLLNGGECEPYLTGDDRLMREQPDDIVAGARLIQRAVAARRIAIAIEDNKPEAIAAMTRAAGQWPDVEVVTVPSRYPMGSAKQLIQAVTGREVPAGGRSNDIGVLVHNVATAHAVYRALKWGRPLISRVVTVAGDAVARPRNVEALIGTPVSELLAACGGLTDEAARLLMGGPMMGMILPGPDVPVIKGAGAILALTARELGHDSSSPCIRCGRCVAACPMGLMPLEMASHARADDFDGAADYGLKDCILCGSCAYVCPSHIPLVQYFQFARGELGQRRSQERKSSYTRALGEARQARLEREAEAKAAARAKRRKRSRDKQETVE